MKKLVRVTGRGVVSLGSLADYEYYEAWVDDEENIHLRPVSIVPASTVPIHRKVDDEQR